MYDRAYPEMLSTASPGNPVGITKPISLLLFVQPDKKKFLEESTKVKETNALTIFCNKSLSKNFSQSKLASKLLAVHIAQPVPQFKRYASL